MHLKTFNYIYPSQKIIFLLPMKKSLLLLAAGIGMSVASQAQLAVGATSPDWTFTDINGTSQHLYAYLDSGYTVIIDISATWCGPCWSFHNSHVAEALTDHYGPNGTITPGKIKFIFIEGDGSTTNSDLMGTGSSTQGNWVTGTNYPIVDEASLSNTYQIGGFPTFQVICPDRKIKYGGAGYSTAMAQESFWLGYTNGCPSAVSGAESAISAEPINVCAPSTTIQNLGSLPLTAATVNLYNGTTLVSTQAWTGNLATYGTATVNFTGYTPAAGAGQLKAEIISLGDQNLTNNSEITNYDLASLPATTTMVRVDIKTDQYAEETSWELKNGSTVLASTVYTSADNDKSYTYTYAIPANSCLSFTIKDAYGDGINHDTPDPADDGYAKLYDNTTNIELFNIPGADIGNETTKSMKAGGSSAINTVALASDVQIYPNPASSVANLKLHLAETTELNIQVTDLTGRSVYSYNAGTQQAGGFNHSISTAALAPGIYNVKIATTAGTQTTRLTVIK